ncbi:hypothetical protein J6590_080768 [Homalodisca vitripennis]|nr:hypothetical protein J6590_080768 [Homalodisca vitripennis]
MSGKCAKCTLEVVSGDFIVKCVESSLVFYPGCTSIGAGRAEILATTTLNYSEQNARCANLEIFGIPLIPGEDVYVSLVRILTVIGRRPFVKEDISMADRLWLFSRQHAQPPIVI